MFCHSLLQWTTFFQTSPPWPTHLGLPHGHGLVSLLDKAMVLVWLDWLVFCEYGFSASALWCPLAKPTILLGFLLPWAWGISSRLLQQSAATAPYLGQRVSMHTCALYIKRRFFHSPRSTFHDFKSFEITPIEKACFGLWLKTCVCPVSHMSVSKTSPSKQKLSVLGTKGQAGKRRQEGDRIKAPLQLHPKPWLAVCPEIPVCFLPPHYPVATKDNIHPA